MKDFIFEWINGYIWNSLSLLRVIFVVDLILIVLFVSFKKRIVDYLKRDEKIAVDKAVYHKIDVHNNTTGIYSLIKSIHFGNDINAPFIYGLNVFITMLELPENVFINKKIESAKMRYYNALIQLSELINEYYDHYNEQRLYKLKSIYRGHDEAIDWENNEHMKAVKMEVEESMRGYVVVTKRNLTV